MVILRMVARRMLLALITLVLVSLTIFFIVEILPGDVATRILARNATPASIAALRAEFGLDEPALVRYARWFTGVLHFEFGNSFTGARPIADLLKPRLFNTALLAGVAFLLYMPLVVTVALYQAQHRGGPGDHFLSVLTLIVLSIPEFLLGTLLLWLFVVIIPVLPAMSLVGANSSAREFARAIALPAVTLALMMGVYTVRMLRDNLIEVLDSDYVRMAELKGLSRRQVMLRHALPNVLTPTLNVTAINIATMVGGIVVIEKVFSYPGFGSLLVDSLQLRDTPLIEATVLIAAAIYIAANLIADIGTILLNPKLRV